MDRAGLAAILGYTGRVADPVAGPRVVAATNPAEFQFAFAAAVAEAEQVFLADPDWAPAERAVLAEALRLRPAGPAGRGWLMIRTGGTSGGLKFARHDEETIWAAVNGYGAREPKPARAVGVLPLSHVSGLMAWLRCALSGGTYLAWDWKQLEAGAVPEIAQPEQWTLSLVPTQLQRLLPQPAVVAWLRRLRAVYVGGAAAWPELLECAAAEMLPLSPCYGMTETAAMVTALDPGDFRTGARDCGPALPHASVIVTPEGRIRVGGPSLFRGYWPEYSDAREFETPDLGRIDDARHLHVLGRSDLVIVTGGKKVNPLEVEAVLRRSGEFEDIVVVGVPDPEWGESVVALYPAGGHQPDLARVETALRDLPAYARPKRLAPLAHWPRNAQGKIDRAAIARSESSSGEHKQAVSARIRIP